MNKVEETLEMNALIFAMYRGIEGALKGLKEYRENQGKIPNDVMDIESFKQFG